MATFVISAIIAVVFVLIVVNEVKKRKNGGGCSCGCSGCSMSGACHNAKSKTK